MPLESDKNGNVTIIPYKIPESVERYFRNDLFAKIFIDHAIEIFNINDYEELEKTDDICVFLESDPKETTYKLISSMYMNSSAGGFKKAYDKTCNDIGNPGLIEQVPGDWYDYDSFIDQVLEIIGMTHFGHEVYNEMTKKCIKENEEFKMLKDELEDFDMADDLTF